MNTTATESEEWELLQSFLPAGWEEQARQTGAFLRSRQVRSVADLLRLVLVSAGIGLSYQRTAEVAAVSGVGQLSKVAIWKRTQRCEPWLEGLVQEMLADRLEHRVAGLYRPRAVDGSVCAGPRGKVQVRLHYVLDLLTLRPTQTLVTSLQEGESLTRLTVAPGDLWIGDRGFARVKNVAWVKAGGGEVLFRLGRRTLRLYGRDGQQLDLLHECRKLSGETPEECPAWCETPSGGRTEGRLVMLRMSPEAVAAAQRKAFRTGQRTQRQLQPETIEMAGYLCLFTTAPKEHLGIAEVLAWFRARWQVELAFKRLKSLLKASELRATSVARARLWLLAKMLYALLLDACLEEAGAFSPSGDRRPESAAEVATLLCAGVGHDGAPAAGAGAGAIGRYAAPAAGVAG